MCIGACGERSTGWLVPGVARWGLKRAGQEELSVQLSASASLSFAILSFLPLVFIAQTILVGLPEKQQILCCLIQFFSVKHIESLLLLFPAKLFLHWAMNFLRDSEAFGLLLSWVSRQGVTVQHALAWSLWSCQLPAAAAAVAGVCAGMHHHTWLLLSVVAFPRMLCSLPEPQYQSSRVGSQAVALSCVPSLIHGCNNLNL